jgi:hypothetical protein
MFTPACREIINRMWIQPAKRANLKLRIGRVSYSEDRNLAEGRWLLQGDKISAVTGEKVSRRD